MANKLDHIYNACNPLLPAQEEFYFDCREARGDDAFLKNVFNHLKRNSPVKKGESAKERFRHFLFSGHIGSGKSSELKHLVNQFIKKSEAELNMNFFPIYIDTFDYLDVFDVSITEILLSIVAELAESLKSIGINLKSDYLSNQLKSVKDIFSELEIDSFEIGAWKSKLKINRLKQDENARQIIRKALGNKVPTILSEINLLFDRARLEIRKQKGGELSLKYSDIVIIIDNLEKIEKFEDFSEGLESYEHLFIDNYPILTGLQSHIIFTVPLRLVRSTVGNTLRDFYSSIFVLPMVKTFIRGKEESYPKGISALKAVLQKRLGKKIKLEEAFTDDALDFLIKYCGGNIRYLISFVREATTYTDNLPLTISEAKNAIKQTVSIFSTTIPHHHWELLAKLDLSADQRFPNNDDNYRKMLNNLSVLEYINGGDDDVFEEVAPWYAVNPIVRELRQFKEARERIKAEQSKISTK